MNASVDPSPSSLRARLQGLRQRLRSRPDSEHEMAINRIVISTLVLVYLYVGRWLGLIEQSDALNDGKILVLSYLAAGIVIMWHIILQPGISPPRRHFAMAMDMTVISFGMYFGNSTVAFCYPLYLWTIFGNGFRFGVPYLWRSMMVALVGFACVIYSTPIWHENLDLSFGLWLGLLILPAYVATLIKKLSEAKLQAEAASKAKSLFLASVSHELRTPLNAIITLSDLLKGGKLDREHRDMAATIGESGRFLLDLINNILDLSRIEAGKQPVKQAEFHLIDALSKLRRVLEVQARKKGLDLRLMIGEGIPSQLHGSVQELEQVLTNLVGNAIKFTEAGNVTITVSVARHQASAKFQDDSGSRASSEPAVPSITLRFDIADTGIGIKPEALTKIFESFTQADDSIIDRFGGTGLGLSIVKQLVERNGGRVMVASQLGRGSTFSFTMSFARPDADVETPFLRAPIILATQDFALPVRFARFGAEVTRVTSVFALMTALEAWSSDDTDPIVLLDLDTFPDTTIGNMMAVICEHRGFVVTGLITARPDAWPTQAPMMLTMAIPSQPTPDNWLMLTRAAACQITSETPTEAPTVNARILSILVAEDNGTNQIVIRKLLEQCGHRVTIVDNGEKAVEALEQGAFDVVLMDINMPVMNGFEATKLHRFASLGRPRTPIYALTADVTDETRMRAEEAGMDGCLHKPIDWPELEAVLRKMSEGKASSAIPAIMQTEPASDLGLDLSQVEMVDMAAIGNLEHLGGIEFVADLMAQFGRDARAHIVELQRAVANCDTQLFRDVAHSMRSSAANVGARRIFAMCLDWRAASAAQLEGEGEAWLHELNEILLETEAAVSVLITDRYLQGLRAAG